MRASPAFQVVLDRFGVWRAFVLAAVLIGAGLMVAWLVSQPPAVPVVVRAGLVAAALVLLLLGASTARVPPVSVRWNGQHWHLGPPDSAGHEPDSGDLRVVLDLGPWMLLRFEPAEPTWRTHATWLPVQRHGLEPQWHALRCAVYSPRPQPGSGSAAGF